MDVCEPRRGLCRRARLWCECECVCGARVWLCLQDPPPHAKWGCRKKKADPSAPYRSKSSAPRRQARTPSAHPSALPELEAERGNGKSQGYAAGIRWGISGWASFCHPNASTYKGRYPGSLGRGQSVGDQVQDQGWGQRCLLDPGFGGWLNSLSDHPPAQRPHVVPWPRGFQAARAWDSLKCMQI